jgi:hypothetical protein
MPRFKKDSSDQGLLLNVNLGGQLLPGTIEHTINDILENHLSTPD